MDYYIWWAVAGMGLIIAAGVAATLLRTRTAPQTPPEDHTG